MKDLIIPIVFPDYRISIAIAGANIDLLPWTNAGNIRLPATTQKLSNLGHAGIMLVDGKTGTTKYYEYGRYDPPACKGLIRRLPIPDAVTDSNGIVVSSLIAPLQRLSDIAGQCGHLRAVVIEADSAFKKLDEKILLRKVQNNNPNRKPYDLVTNSCIHFVKWVVDASGNQSPWMIDPRPNSYIGEFRENYPDLDYLPRQKILRIENLGEFR